MNILLIERILNVNEDGNLIFGDSLIFSTNIHKI